MPHPFTSSAMHRHVRIALGITALWLPPLVAPAAGVSDAAPTRATEDQGYALVQLNGDPLATYVKTKPAKGKKIDFSSSAVKSYRAQLSALRNSYKQWLRANAPKAKVTGEFDTSLNAVAVQLNGATLQQVSATPLVKAALHRRQRIREPGGPGGVPIGERQAGAQVSRPWQCLYFLPLPLGQGLLRPTFGTLPAGSAATAPAAPVRAATVASA